MIAKFDGRCEVCHGAIIAGLHEIVWNGDAWVHAGECEDRNPEPEPADAPVCPSCYMVHVGECL